MTAAALNRKPTLSDLLWLLGESPKFNVILKEFREGYATANELALVLWPYAKPVAAKALDNLTPAEFVARLLDTEASQNGRFVRKDGNLYLAMKNASDGKTRPKDLPFWPDPAIMEKL